jgi:hypothetical protein
MCLSFDQHQHKSGIKYELASCGVLQQEQCICVYE